MGGMMWMMAICSAVPLLLLFFLSTGSLANETASWTVAGGVVLMLVAHYVMMRKMQSVSTGERHDSSHDCVDDEKSGCCKKEDRKPSCCTNH
jgi:hypothetical protein